MRVTARVVPRSVIEKQTREREELATGLLDPSFVETGIFTLLFALPTNYAIKRGVANFKKHTRTILCTVEPPLSELFIFNMKLLYYCNEMLASDLHHLSSKFSYFYVALALKFCNFVILNAS